METQSPSTDLGLMVGFMRDLVHGLGERDPWTTRLQELKTRGLIRQTQSGRSLPTETGQALWDHAKRAVAREVLGLSDAKSRRPCFVVFDAEERPVAFTEWDIAVSFARWQMEMRPDAYLGVGVPEDVVELWDRSSLSPGEAERLDEAGQVAVARDAGEAAA